MSGISGSSADSGGSVDAPTATDQPSAADDLTVSVPEQLPEAGKASAAAKDGPPAEAGATKLPEAGKASAAAKDGPPAEAGATKLPEAGKASAAAKDGPPAEAGATKLPEAGKASAAAKDGPPAEAGATKLPEAGKASAAAKDGPPAEAGATKLPEAGKASAAAKDAPPAEAGATKLPEAGKASAAAKDGPPAEAGATKLPEAGKVNVPPSRGTVEVRFGVFRPNIPDTSHTSAPGVRNNSSDRIDTLWKMPIGQLSRALSDHIAAFLSDYEQAVNSFALALNLAVGPTGKAIADGIIESFIKNLLDTALGVVQGGPVGKVVTKVTAELAAKIFGHNVDNLKANRDTADREAALSFATSLRERFHLAIRDVGQDKEIDAAQVESDYAKLSAPEQVLLRSDMIDAIQQLEAAKISQGTAFGQMVALYFEQSNQADAFNRNEIRYDIDKSGAIQHVTLIGPETSQIAAQARSQPPTSRSDFVRALTAAHIHGSVRISGGGDASKEEMFRYVPGMKIDDYDFHTVRDLSGEVATKLRDGTVEIGDDVKIDFLTGYR